MPELCSTPNSTSNTALHSMISFQSLTVLLAITAAASGLCYSIAYANGTDVNDYDCLGSCSDPSCYLS